MQTINVIGLGLIGASVAKKLKSKGYSVLGFDINPEVMREALAENVIDGVASSPYSGVVVICIYPHQAIEFLNNNDLKDAIITDVLGIKLPLTNEAKKLGLNYIGMHPMAGKETWGYGNSTEDLFVGRNFILTNENKVVEDLAKDLGAGRIRYMDAETHDKLIAFTSQLPHVIAAATVLCEDYKDSDGATGGSIEDITRVGHINEKLWSQLFEENEEYLVPCIDEFIRNLENIKQAVINKSSQEVLRKSRENMN